MLLHVWISVFGSSEAATHSLSVVFGLLCIPAGMWAGWSLFGRRAGLYAAVLFAFSTFLTAYAQETRMYELMALLGILETAAFIHAFVYRRRRYLILFAVCQALMLYTHGVGHLLRGRNRARADPDLARQRRPPRARPRRGARVRRRRDPVPPMAPELHLPGHTHGRAVGADDPLRRAGPAFARPSR